MALRSFDPITDHALMDREQERKESRARYSLAFDDLLDKPIEVDGVTYDLKVYASFTRDGKAGSIEINSLDLSDDLYIFYPEFSDGILVDRIKFRAREKHKHGRLENAIEFLALKKAAASFDWEEEESGE
jgi:hypothetical protein